MIDALNSSNPYVPYRESKLTFILRDSLGGNSYCSFIATISPYSSNFDETKSTVEFAMRAKNLKNEVKANIIRKNANFELLSQNKELGSKIKLMEKEIVKPEKRNIIDKKSNVNNEDKILEIEADNENEINKYSDEDDDEINSSMWSLKFMNELNKYSDEEDDEINSSMWSLKFINELNK